MELRRGENRQCICDKNQHKTYQGSEASCTSPPPHPTDFIEKSFVVNAHSN